jgi:hypothetical protein
VADELGSLVARRAFMTTIYKHAVAVAVIVAGSMSAAETTEKPRPIEKLNQPMVSNQSMAQLEAAHLDTFDDLDFKVFSGQQWAEMHRSHSQDVLVHWPDGHTTKGLDKHIEDLEAMFAMAPDTRIEIHPVKVAKGDWTAVIGVMEGTSAKTRKPYTITMATFSHWTDAGLMDEEFLFWDNAALHRQMGLGK